MRQERGWAAWESYVNDELGLLGTAGSGNQWYQKGDGYDPSDDEWAFQVDAKYTDKASRSIPIKEFTQLSDQARMAGKKFALPVRLWPCNRPGPLDVVVVSFEDFQGLLREVHGE